MKLTGAKITGAIAATLGLGDLALVATHAVIRFYPASVPWFILITIAWATATIVAVILRVGSFGHALRCFELGYKARMSDELALTRAGTPEPRSASDRRRRAG